MCPETLKVNEASVETGKSDMLTCVVVVTAGSAESAAPLSVDQSVEIMGSAFAASGSTCTSVSLSGATDWGGTSIGSALNVLVSRHTKTFNINV